MQQRLQIARSLAQDPSVLLMDEPFGALDAMTRQSLQDEVLRIAAERQATVLFVTHDLEEALYLGDRVIALYSNPGRIARMVDIPAAAAARPARHARASRVPATAARAVHGDGGDPRVRRWRGIVVPVALLVAGGDRLPRQRRGQRQPRAAVASRGRAAECARRRIAAARHGARRWRRCWPGWRSAAPRGLAAGIALGFSETLRRAAFLTIELLRPIPSVALLPLSLLIFGFGYRMEIAVIAFATFWPSLILTQNAVAQIEPRLIEVARLMGLSRLQTAWKIVLPAAAPRLMTALRLAAGLALVVAVTAEIVSNPQGLGHDLMIAQETLRPERMFAVLFWVGLIGWGKNAALLRLERWLFAHRGEVDTSVAA